jgi:multidrug transporter EmrE-like cation transporter
MAFAFLNILFVLVFSQSLRYSQVRGARDYVAGAVNYVLAAMLAWVALAYVASREPLTWWPAAALGAAEGASFFGQFLLLLVAYRLAGVGITTATTAAGIVVPVLVAWMYWGEPMTPWRWAAMAMVPASMVLMRPSRSPHPHLNWKADLALAASFLNSGLASVLHKAANIYAPAAAPTVLFFRPHQIIYEAVLFLVRVKECIEDPERLLLGV